MHCIAHNHRSITLAFLILSTVSVPAVAQVATSPSQDPSYELPPVTVTQPAKPAPEKQTKKASEPPPTAEKAPVAAQQSSKPRAHGEPGNPVVAGTTKATAVADEAQSAVSPRSMPTSAELCRTFCKAFRESTSCRPTVPAA
jgi:hypothetical protein